ncbi:N-alpha-acetyltransferase 40 isoform X2 [Theropithecus gelada]|uniref:N-alpha-acetyltransferase 40 isoform X2 n=1 Tax=Theropithecus gelada TaxID=9565 RepID=UPI000DC1939D|nr:N-alpha-acetyltransferase 40 isoform X2 [Theropithecus gelada]
MRGAGYAALQPPLLPPPPLPPPCRQVCEGVEGRRRRYGEEVKQSQGEEAEAVGGASSHGCCLCQSGRCQQGDAKLNSRGPPHQSLPRTCDFRARQMEGSGTLLLGLKLVSHCGSPQHPTPRQQLLGQGLHLRHTCLCYSSFSFPPQLGDPLEAFPVFKKYDRNGTQMKKVMLTVFKHNHGAYQFFREALQFEIDDSSPSMSGCCGEDCSYEILSRRTKFGDSQHSHAGGHCGGCCH